MAVGRTMVWSLERKHYQGAVQGAAEERHKERIEVRPPGARACRRAWHPLSRSLYQQLLNNAPIFAKLELSTTELTSVADALVDVDLEKGEVACRQDAPAEAFFIVVAGECGAFRADAHGTSLEHDSLAHRRTLLRRRPGAGGRARRQGHVRRRGPRHATGRARGRRAGPRRRVALGPARQGRGDPSARADQAGGPD